MHLVGRCLLTITVTRPGCSTWLDGPPPFGLMTSDSKVERDIKFHTLVSSTSTDHLQKQRGANEDPHVLASGYFHHIPLKTLFDYCFLLFLQACSD